MHDLFNFNLKLSHLSQLPFRCAEPSLSPSLSLMRRERNKVTPPFYASVDGAYNIALLDMSGRVLKRQKIQHRVKERVVSFQFKD